MPVGGWVLGEGLPRLIDGLSEMVKNIDWERLNEALKDFWGALSPFAIHVGEGLLWFYENVLLKLGEWTMNELVPAFLDLMTAGLDALNNIIEIFEPLWDWLWGEFLEPAAKWTGQKIIDGIKWLTEKLQAFSDWCKADDEHVEVMKAIMMGLFAGIVFYCTVKGIKNLIQKVTDVLTIFGSEGFIAGLKLGVTAVIIGALAAAIIYLCLLYTSRCV